MKLLSNLGLAILAVFAPIKAAIITVLVLVVFDLITGVWAAQKRNEPIMSSGFRRTIVKLFLYEIALAMGFLAETYLLDAALPISKIVSAFIGLTELKSVMENMNEIGGGNLFASLIAKLGSDNTKSE
jgi:phage-related holin